MRTAAGVKCNYLHWLILCSVCAALGHGRVLRAQAQASQALEVSLTESTTDNALRLLRTLAAAATLEERVIDLSLPLEGQVGCPAAATDTWIAVFNELNARVLLQGQFGRKAVRLPPCLTIPERLVAVEGGDLEDIKQQYRLHNGRDPSPADLSRVISVGSRVYIPQTRVVAAVTVDSARLGQLTSLNGPSVWT